MYEEEPYHHLPTYKLAAVVSPESRSGTATPPLHASASVPFKWEEQPGRPRPCTDVIIRPDPARCLDLPPCRITKMPSPTTVLDGPDNLGRPKFSSFRLFREKRLSFDGGGGSHVDHELVGKRGGGGGRRKMSGLFGRSLRERSGDEGSLGFSPSSSFSLSVSASTPLWATMCEGLKQAIKWKRTRKCN
ncbi:hypothetical protein AAHA92_01586 [Salvia divinorum]|uniref:Uncharacterized protein n=1 Tax=Salvia divinorum TaxID=28513 RepID=A0ABD1IB15_SALDI